MEEDKGMEMVDKMDQASNITKVILHKKHLERQNNKKLAKYQTFLEIWVL